MANASRLWPQERMGEDFLMAHCATENRTDTSRWSHVPQSLHLLDWPDHHDWGTLGGRVIARPRGLCPKDSPQ